MQTIRAALIGEFFGTMILIILGDGVVGSAVLLDKAEAGDSNQAA